VITRIVSNKRKNAAGNDDGIEGKKKPQLMTTIAWKKRRNNS